MLQKNAFLLVLEGIDYVHPVQVGSIVKGSTEGQRWGGYRQLAKELFDVFHLFQLPTA